MSTKFGDWLAKELRRREMSQSELARRLDTRPSTVNGWIRGGRNPDPDSCFALADVLFTSPSRILALAGHPTDTTVSVDPDEDRLLHIYRSLPADRRRTVLEFAEFHALHAGRMD